MSFVDVEMPGLGEVALTPRQKYIHQVQFFLVKTLEAARIFRDNTKSSLFGSDLEEAAQTFYLQVEGMVVRLLTVGSDGVFSWERRPQALTALADFVQSEQRSLQVLPTFNPLVEAFDLALTGLRKLAGTAGEHAADALEATAAKLVEVLDRNLNKGTSGVATLLVMGLIVGAAVMYAVND